VLTNDLASNQFELYDLVADPQESNDLREEQPEVFAQFRQQLIAWNTSMDASFSGRDYPQATVAPPDPKPINWYEAPEYRPFLKEWKQRDEYQSFLGRATSAEPQGNN
jgi:hypothetical protein